MTTHSEAIPTPPPPAAHIILRMRIVARCRKLMATGTFRPTVADLCGGPVRRKSVQAFFPDLSSLYEEALDLATLHDIRDYLVPTGARPSIDDFRRLTEVLVFGRPLQ